MNFSLKKYGLWGLIALCLVIISVMLPGCKKEEDATDELVIEDDTETLQTDEGEVDVKSFWVEAYKDPSKAQPGTAFIHKNGDSQSNCEIFQGDFNNPTLADISCTVEVNEQEMHHNTGYAVQYNLPPGLCTYLEVYEPYHYAQPVGRGPTRVDIEIDENGNVIDYSSTPSDMVYVGPDAAPKCVYDHASKDSDKPYLQNCCYGDYMLVVDKDGEVTATEANWGGSIGSCLSGPAAIGLNGETTVDENGYPGGIIHDAEQGVNVVIQVPALNSMSYWNNSNVFGTSYYTDTITTDPDGPSGPVTFTDIHEHCGEDELEEIGSSGIFQCESGATMSSLPVAIDPLNDLGGTPRLRARDEFQFNCTDPDRETKAFIRVKVREWNTLAEFELYKETNSGNPDLVLDEWLGLFSTEDFADFEWGELTTDRFPFEFPAQPFPHPGYYPIGPSAGTEGGITAAN